MIQSGLRERLVGSPHRSKLVAHPFLSRCREGELNRAQVALLLGQWWHPLHFFPDFLARSVANIAPMEAKSAIAKILNEEVGQGDAQQAHEKIFIHTMVEAGFIKSAVVDADPIKETALLVEGYRDASGSSLGALGFIYGTEVIDLTLVSGIGKAVSRVSGRKNLPWVAIHQGQEPGHVAQAQTVINLDFAPSEQAEIFKSAEQMWQLWGDFFSGLEREAESSYLLAG